MTLIRVAHPLAAMALVFIAACERKEIPEPRSPVTSGGASEARLTSIPPSGQSPSKMRPCDRITATHAGALQILADGNTRPGCLDAAVESLRRLSRQKRDARLLSDLAAAHLIRAARMKERESADDLMCAFDAAEGAAALAPRLPEARFNRALAHEALGLDSASEAWRAAENADRTPWAAKAAANRRRLEELAASRAATQWDSSRIAMIADQGDDAALAKLVGQHPSTAVRFVEEDLLPAWARAQSAEASRFLAQAETIAAQYERVTTGDRFLIDGITAIRQAAATDREALRAAHCALRDARLVERSHAAAAIVHYQRAQRLFRQARSPFEASAKLGEITARFFARANPAELVVMLSALERTVVQPRNYLYLQSRIQANIGHFLFAQSLYIDAIAQYDVAIGTASRMRDVDATAAYRHRKAGLLRSTGRVEAAAREALAAVREEPGLADVLDRQHALGEMAEDALALGHPKLALVYVDKSVDLLQRAISTPGAQPAQVAKLENSLAIELRTRVSVNLALGLHQNAQKDVNEAIRLASRKQNADENIRRILLARIWESAGHQALDTNRPAEAAAAFDEAIRQALPEEYRAYKAMLLVNRADAHARSGDNDRAERDLVAAIQEIRHEERELLRHRVRGQHEAYWTSYFSRFRETYDRLVQHLVQTQRPREAFAYAESYRAFEPLDLVAQLPVAPESFQRWARNGETRSLEEIQRSLPDGTYLVSFYVLHHRTYAWIVGRNAFENVELSVGKETIDEWSVSLPRYAVEKSADSFEAILENAYDALVDAPLRKITELTGGVQEATLVFVPDRSIHGLPLAALKNRRSRKYVVQDYVVSIAPSATLYNFSLQRDRQLADSAGRSILLIADPAFNKELDFTRHLDELPATRSEIARIALKYAPHAAPYYAEDATVPLFLRESAHHTIVHFAGHAVANPNEPFRSLLLFAPGGGHNGLLSAEELLRSLKFGGTRLLILASCSSSGGVAVGPEGLAPLVRPFLTSGVPAVVGTLWDVYDARSEAVLVAFHEHYRSGLSAEAALRKAQLDMIGKADPAAQSPLAWSPYQVIGHAGSPFRSNQ